MSPSRVTETRSPGQGNNVEDARPHGMSQEELNKELDNDIEEMLTQDPLEEEAEVGGTREEGGAGDDDDDDEDGDEDDDDDEKDDGGYVSPEDPHPFEPRHRPTQAELDEDYDPTKEVEIKLY
jgi:hypothetical protein